RGELCPGPAPAHGSARAGGIAHLFPHRRPGHRFREHHRPALRSGGRHLPARPRPTRPHALRRSVAPAPRAGRTACRTRRRTLEDVSPRVTATRLPPGPKGHLLTGNLAELRRDLLGLYLRCARDYGDVFSLRFGLRRVTFLCHPDLIEEVLVTQAR